MNILCTHKISIISKKKLILKINLRPNLMNLSWVAELPTAGLNLNHRFKVKNTEGIESGIQNLPGSR